MHRHINTYTYLYIHLYVCIYTHVMRTFHRLPCMWSVSFGFLTVAPIVTQRIGPCGLCGGGVPTGGLSRYDSKDPKGSRYPNICGCWMQNALMLRCLQPKNRKNWILGPYGTARVQAKHVIEPLDPYSRDYEGLLGAVRGRLGSILAMDRWMS